MSTAVQRRRGTTAENDAFTGLEGEFTYDTQRKTIRTHDGSTAGGFEATFNTASQTLTNKTLTAPVLGGTATGTYTLGGTPTLGANLASSATTHNIGASGAGIGGVFFGTSTTALTVYEQGSWTPVLAGSVTPGTQTYTVQVGRYTRIGNLVWVVGSINLSAFDAATSGNMRITGLPFTALSLAGASTPLAVQNFQFINLNTAGGYTYPNAFVQQGQAYIGLVECGDNIAIASLTEADFANNSTIGVAGIYSV